MSVEVVDVVTNIKIGVEQRGEIEEALIRKKALASLQANRLRHVLQAGEIDGNFGSAGTALKAVMAEKLAEYAIRAMKIARKRGMKLGAAAVIIAAQEG